MLITVIPLIAFLVMRVMGEANLRGKADSASQELKQTIEQQSIEKQTPGEELSDGQDAEKWQEGWVKYKDDIYAYNEDIMTFLFMGIDKNNEVKEVKEGTDGGQADALFLLVLNPHEKTIQVIGINRNTMTDVELYDDNGEYMTTVTAQIAVQHGFGNGMEESCEYQVKAVRNLFYNLPIHGYCAVNMDAVVALTDLIGGIELTALEDVKSRMPVDGSYAVKKGETVVLDGKKAYSYVSYRDVRVSGSADMRLERQKQFLEKFIIKTKAETIKDITLPVKLYNAVTSRMVTDVTADEVAYLASTVLDYSFSRDQFYFLKGETVQGEQFEEYHIDEDALYEMILDIFYEPVEK